MQKIKQNYKDRKIIYRPSITEGEPIMINKVENANDQSKHGESWKLINAITGHKQAKRDILKGNRNKKISVDPQRMKEKKDKEMLENKKGIKCIWY